MSSSIVPLGGHPTRLGGTTRHDTWWLGPMLTVLGIGVCMGYLTWSMLQGNHYYHAPYLSPAAEPILLVKPGVAGGAPVDHSWFGVFPSWWPWFLPASPAFLVLAFPGSFRFTCYYYRKAYYRSFAAAPPACAVVGVPQKKYRGETGLLVFQNLHRYALYLALVFIPILGLGAYRSFFKHGEFGVGAGSIVLTINFLLLSGYTFGCHSWRHLIGGRLDCFTCDAPSRARYGLWKKSTWLNERHMQFAWISLFWIAFTDLYVRLVSMGVIHDFNTWSH